jgi:hypothetical protein
VVRFTYWALLLSYCICDRFFSLPSFLSADLELLDPRFAAGLSLRPSSILLFSRSVLSTSSRVIGGFASSLRCKSLASC